MTAPRFFSGAAEFRTWLTTHHDSASELVVGFHRVNTGTPCMTWTEAVREALCFGWIDGIVKRIDDSTYSRRFTPRKARSTWSAVNVRHAQELIDAGRMEPAGLAAFAARTDGRSGVYSFEQPRLELPEPYAGALREATGAQAFWESLPASYRQAAAWWVISAKQPATRERRTATLIQHCAQHKRLPQFVDPRKRTRD